MARKYQNWSRLQTKCCFFLVHFGFRIPILAQTTGLRPVPMSPPFPGPIFVSSDSALPPFAKSAKDGAAEVSPASGRGGQFHICARFPPKMRDRLLTRRCAICAVLVVAHELSAVPASFPP